MASDKYQSDNFGYAVDITDDGTRIISGAYRADLYQGAVSNVGKAYIFS